MAAELKSLQTIARASKFNSCHRVYSVPVLGAGSVADPVYPLYARCTCLFVADSQFVHNPKFHVIIVDA